MVNFSVGLLYGFVDENNLPEIKKCYTTAKPHWADVMDVVHDLQNEQTSAAINKLKEIQKDMPAIIAQCNLTVEDKKALSAWIA